MDPHPKHLPHGVRTTYLGTPLPQREYRRESVHSWTSRHLADRPGWFPLLLRQYYVSYVA